MSVITQAEAQTRASQIRAATLAGENTADRVGGLLKDVVDSIAFSPDAIPGRAGLVYKFASSTSTSTDPGAGKFRLGNAAPASVVAIAIADADADGGGNEAYLLAQDDSSSTSHRGTIMIRSRVVPGTFAKYDITGTSTNSSGWVQFVVSYLGHDGAFVADDAYDIQFFRTGDKGEPGIDGDDVTGLPAIGAAGTVITSDGTDPVYAQPKQFDKQIRPVGSDSTASILAAITALGGRGRIEVCQGVYDVSSVLTLPDNVELCCSRGAVFRKKTGSTDFNLLLLPGSGSKIFGLEIDGNSQPQGSLILVTGDHNVLEDCYLHDNGVMVGLDTHQSHGINLDGQSTDCNNNRVERCRIVACRGIGIAQNTAPDNRLLVNEISGCGLEGLTIDVTSHRALVERNTIVSCCVVGGVGGIGIDGSDLCRIIGNHVAGMPGSLSGIKTQNSTGGSSSSTYLGNILIDNGGYGLHLYTGTSGNASWNSVCGNIFRNNGVGSVRAEASSSHNNGAGNILNGVAFSDAGTGNAIT